MKKPLLALALCASLTTVQAAEPFVGHYHSGGVDWVQNLMLMNNHRYCFALIAGSLDLLTGGTWQAHKKGNTTIIQLKEMRLNLPPLLLVANFKTNDETWEAEIGKQRALLFSPPELDRSLDISQIYYAFSDGDNTFPKKADYAQTQDNERMFAHITIPDKAQYVFIRTSLNDSQPIYRFHIGNSRRALLTLNEQANRKPVNATLVYNHETKTLVDKDNEQRWGQPEKVSPAAQAKIWQQCQPKAPKTVRRVNGSERSIVMPDILPDK